MTSLRSLTSALLAAALLALAGCGGGGGDAAPTPVQVDTTRTARVTLGPAGGTVVATAADGRRYTLTVEPGALATATEITATPVVSMGSAPLAAGLKGAVRFGPAGLRFALPATLRIEGANPATSAGSKLVGFLRSADGASMQLVPTTVAAAGAIVMRVRHFTDVGASQATAQEVAQVPIDPSMDPVDALALEYIVSVSTNPNTADTIALLVRLHDTLVAPRLTVAELRTVATDTERGTAISVVSEWISLVNDEFAEVPGGLAPLVAVMRQRVAAIINEDFDIGLAACMGPAPIGSAQLAGLENALRTREQLRLFRDNGGLPGLDHATAARRVNDCVRIVFEPRPLPTFEIGRPVSLDFRARLVFAADPNASIDVPFDFDVYAPGSSGPVFGTDFTSFGFSDAQGNYTTVVTPRDAEPEFLAEACMVVSPRNGGPVGSLLCGQQTLRGASPSTITERQIFLRANLINSNLPAVVDVGLTGGFIRTTEVNDVYRGLTQRGRVSSTEDTVGANSTAFAFEADCYGDIVINGVSSTVKFRIERQTVVDISGALSNTSNTSDDRGGGITLTDRTRGGILLLGRFIDRSTPSFTVSESLTLEPGDYEARLTADIECTSFDGRFSYGDPVASSFQGRMGLRVGP